MFQPDDNAAIINRVSFTARRECAAVIERFIIWEADKCWLTEAYLESNPAIALGGSREPLFLGARRLLTLGYDPQALLTTRWRNRSFDNFVPTPIEYLAKLTVREEDRSGLRIRKYEGFPQESRNAA